MHLPHQIRCLFKEEKLKAAKLLEMKANKKIVQQYLLQETGKLILLRDITNIAVSVKMLESKNDLDATVGMLMNKYGKLTTK